MTSSLYREKIIKTWVSLVYKNAYTICFSFLLYFCTHDLHTFSCQAHLQGIYMYWCCFMAKSLVCVLNSAIVCWYRLLQVMSVTAKCCMFNAYFIQFAMKSAHNIVIKDWIWILVLTQDISCNAAISHLKCRYSGQLHSVT